MEEQNKQPAHNPMRSYGIAVIAVLVVIGFYLLLHAKAAQTDDRQRTETNQEQTDEQSQDGKGISGLLESAGKYGAAGEVVLWKDSRDAFTLTVPAEWEIHQNDAGSVRFIEAFSPDNIDDVFTLWIQDAHTAEGRTIQLNEWIDASIAGLSDIVTCKDAMIGGKKMTCRHAANQKSLWNLYFEQRNDNDLLGVFYSDVPENAVLTGVVDSLVIDPTPEQLDGAQIIP